MRMGRRTYLALGIGLLLLSAFLIYRGLSAFKERRELTQSLSELPGSVFLVEQTEAGRTPEDAVGGVFRFDCSSGTRSKLVDRVANHMRVAPDGARVAYCDGGTLWICDGEGNSRRIADVDGQPVWSPDGSQIVCSQGEKVAEGGWRVTTWRFAVSGSGQTRLPIPDTDFVKDWSPDGKWLVVLSDRHLPRGRAYQIYVMRPDGTDQRRLTQDGLNVHPRFSPDSRQILYARHLKRQSWLCVQGLDQTSAQQLYGPTSQSIRACWSPDGQRLALTLGGSRPQLLLLDRTRGTVEPLKLTDGIRIGPVDWH